MSMYGNFAVWALHDKQPVWRDGTETGLLTRVSPSVRLKVLRREAAHYLVRLPDMRQGYVRVDDVAAGPMSAASDMLKREAPKHTGVKADFVGAPILTRFVARVIDSALFWIAILVLALGVGAGGAGEQPEMLPGGVSWVGSDRGVIWLSTFAIWGTAFLYEWIGTAAGGTIGKSMLNVSVIDAATGRAPGLMKSFVRYASQTVVNIVLSIFCFLALYEEMWAVAGVLFLLHFVPYVLALVVEGGRTLYDRMAGTWVVQYR
jgi:uncharacterized RDD family membrane protein YckC